MGYESQDTGESGLAAQLSSLYGEREFLQREIGASDATEVVNMVKSMEAQLKAFYEEQVTGTRDNSGGSPVEEILSLRQQFSDCGRPEITFEAADGRRLLRATWKAA